MKSNYLKRPMTWREFLSGLTLLIILPIMTNIASEILIVSFSEKLKAQDPVADFPIDENPNFRVGFTAEECPQAQLDGASLNLYSQDESLLGYYLQHPKAGIVIELKFLDSTQTIQSRSGFGSYIHDFSTSTPEYFVNQDIQQAIDDIESVVETQSKLNFFQFEMPYGQTTSSLSGQSFIKNDIDLVETIPPYKKTDSLYSSEFKFLLDLPPSSIPSATDKDNHEECPGVTIPKSGSHTWCGPGSEMY